MREGKVITSNLPAEVPSRHILRRPSGANARDRAGVRSHWLHRDPRSRDEGLERRKGLRDRIRRGREGRMGLPSEDHGGLGEVSGIRHGHSSHRAEESDDGSRRAEDCSLGEEGALGGRSMGLDRGILRDDRGAESATG